MSDQPTSADANTDLALEIAHLLFIDVVGYSKLLVNEQVELMKQLNRIVRGTDSFRRAEAEKKLIRLPTGDGMVLLFFRSPEEPVKCALEISEALREQPQIQLRMGVHSGPVNQVVDVNDQINMAGAAINVGQRVMDCGDAGHILISKHVADDLVEFSHWRPRLHDLGECEVKHGLRIHVFNLAKDELGNLQLPQKFRHGRRWKPINGSVIGLVKPATWPKSLHAAATFLSIAALGLSFWLLYKWKTSVPVSAAPDKSIAVLPFENLSAERENAFFTDGVQDEILTDLAKVADLKVISRTSVMQYKNAAKRNLREIAQQLGVSYVLEGSVQRADNRVHVTAQLIDAKTDTHLWAEKYDGDLVDVFGIQSEIAKAIADHLQAQISPAEKFAIEKPPTNDLVAFELYERAESIWAYVTNPVYAKEKLPEAVQLLDQAVHRDPNFLAGWCLLSRIHGAIYWYGFDRSPARLDLANNAVQTGLRLQPNAGEAHLSLAIYYYYCFLDYDAARRELASAKRDLPNSSEVFAYIGYIERRQGHWDEAARNLEHALELDPRNLFMLQQLALSYLAQRRYADEARVLNRILAIAPNDPGTLIAKSVIPLHQNADIRPFQSALAEVISKDPSAAPDVDDPDFALCERTSAAAARTLENYPREGESADYGVNCPHSYWEGVVARWLGDSARASHAFGTARKEVEQTLEKQPDFAAALSLLGIIDAGLGRKDQALREGRRACELLPISKDAVDGAALAINLAQIYAWTGEKELAIEQLTAVERVPSVLSYGELKLHPYWDSLRGDPRFQKIVASLAPR